MLTLKWTRRLHRFELSYTTDIYTKTPIKVRSWNDIFALPPPRTKGISRIISSKIGLKERYKTEVREAVLSAMLDSGLQPTGYKGADPSFDPINVPVDLFFTFHIPGKRWRDVSNTGVVCKFVEDALVHYGLLVDDDDRYVTMPVSYIVRAQRPVVVLSIFEATESNHDAMSKL